MTKIFNPVFLDGNEVVFWIFVISMLVIMILTLIFVLKELKKNDNK